VQTTELAKLPEGGQSWSPGTFETSTDVRSAAAEGLPPCCRRGHRSRHRRPPPYCGRADARPRGDARGGDGGVREELAA